MVSLSFKSPTRCYEPTYRCQSLQRVLGEGAVVDNSRKIIKTYLLDNIPLVKARPVAQGTVKWFNQTKGFGFIEQEGGKDLFVHISEVEGEIQDGDTVEFEVGEGPKGPNAVGVRKVE